MTFPVGIISALAGFGNDRRMIQISTPVQPGNSGSPLLDQSGNVVGIVSGETNTIQVAGTSSETPQNVNFAVNLGTIQSFLDSYAVPYVLNDSTETKKYADIAADEIASIFSIKSPVGSGRPATVVHRDGDIGTKVRWRYGTAVVRRRDPFSETKAPASLLGLLPCNSTLHRRYALTSTQPDCAVVRFGCDGILEARPSNGLRQQFPRLGHSDQYRPMLGRSHHASELQTLLGVLTIFFYVGGEP
jgi:hypothetical protein